MSEPHPDPLLGAVLQVAATMDEISQRLARIGGALDRLAPIVPVPEPTPCIRCGGQGWLGSQLVACHACGGTGHQP